MSARTLLVASLATCALLVANGCKTTDGRAGRDAIDVQAQVLAVCHAQEAAWNRGDVEGFMRAGYWQSDDLTFFSGDEVTRGFQPMLERFRARYASEGKEMGHLTFGDLEAMPMSDGWACARGRWKLHFEHEDDVGGLFTLILHKTSDGWRIVHDHTSVASS